MAFANVMNLLKDEYHLLSMDMPGIGKSDPIESSDKLEIANFINNLIQELNLCNVILVGHDLGGMVTYSFIRNFPESVSKAVIMNTAIPGVEPWEDIKRNPYIWHFAFFAIPELPERVLTGKQRVLFDYFFDSIAANKTAIDDKMKDNYVAAHNSPSSLKTSFDWYRAFNQDEKKNSEYIPVDIPVLYLRGEKEYGNIAQYLIGFKKSGINYIEGKLIPNSGHFAPEDVAKAINNFLMH